MLSIRDVVFDDTLEEATNNLDRDGICELGRDSQGKRS